MNPTTTRPPDKSAVTVCAAAMAALDHAIAQARAKVERLLAAREVMAELNGVRAEPTTIPAAAAAARPAPVRGAPHGKMKGGTIRRPDKVVQEDRHERQLIVARALLSGGPMTFSSIQRLLGKSPETTTKTLRCGWFLKSGDQRPGAPGLWGLTAEGHAAATRNSLPPAPAGDMRHNPDLDDLFDPRPPENNDPKSHPRPFSLNGTGAHHPNGTAEAAETSTHAILRMLAERGPTPYTVICRAISCNPTTISKSLNRLMDRGFVVKGTENHRSPWGITQAGREALAQN